MAYYLPSALLLGMAGVALFVSSRYFGHALSPFGVFYGVWFFTLSLFFARLVDYTPVRSFAWMLIALNLTCFGLGWLLAYLFHRPSSIMRNVIYSGQGMSTEKMAKVILLFFVLGMVGLADFLWTVQRTLGLATYLIAPHEIREAMSLGGDIVEGLRVLNWLNICNTVLCTFYLYVLHGNRRKQVWFILIISIFSTIFMEDRTRFFFAILWAGYVLIHARQWNTRRVLTGVAITGIVLMIQFFAMANWLGKIAENNPVLLAAANVEDVFTPILTPYAYATGSFPALQAYVDSSPDRTFGAMTFYPAFKILRLVNPHLKLPQVVAEPFEVPSEINTFTWLHQFYTDFGVAGVAVGPWLVVRSQTR